MMQLCFSDYPYICCNIPAIENWIKDELYLQFLCEFNEISIKYKVYYCTHSNI